ncbi:MAG TPA: beta-ketoacyl-[acyl-carrier-protein] synthase family protein, partial [Blastocatellia bacterium]|nr:beta-ketoacyl-[acyl-carrier-protein] synthase family protein [Blastocatellia bacterium]
MQSRVVITGIGVVTSIGTGRGHFWDALLSGRSGVSEVESFDTSAYTVHRGAEVRGFRARDYVRKLDSSRMGRASQMAIAAARLALSDADVNVQALDPHRIGVTVGTTSGEPQLIERFDDAAVSHELESIGEEFITLYPCHVIAAHVAAEFGFRGVNTTLPTACAAGNYAIANAFDIIRAGRADLMLAGGSDSFSRITFTGFARLGAVAPDLCRPFDRDRKGMIPGEGAGILVLEQLEHATRRGARVYAEVAGYGLSCDARHMTAPHPEGPARAMRKALATSGIAPAEVSYISAHGTGTAANDRVETQAVKSVFNGLARRIPISSIKSMLGHAMGAASALEAAACALAICDGVVPPTMNLQNSDPDCDLDYVPNSARELNVDV